MAYDSMHHQVVLFGGVGAGPSSPVDTWTWDGLNWTQQFPQTSPPGRYGHVMVYDSAHGEVVLFGGANPLNRNQVFDDTWVWDGINWTQQFPQVSPPARLYYAMGYDSAHGEVVMFGGYNNPAQAGDTWAWDGTNWVQKFPQTSPTARSGDSMAYDSANGQLVLFGGYNGADWLNDTWAWDGSNWAQKFPLKSPSARSGYALTYDSASNQMVMFGGATGAAPFSDAWIWDGSNWTQDSKQTSPGARESPVMAYDSGHDQIVLFGGYTSATVFNETWTRSGAAIANPPTISGVVSASAFGGFASVAPGSWIEIYGSNFATDTHGWTAADFTGNNAPTSLGGVNVSVGGQAAFVDYVSPGQVDVQLPSNIATGTLQLSLTNANGTSAPQSLTVQAAEPGLLAPSSFKIGANQYVVAQFIDGTYVAPTSAIAGVTSRPAKPGDTIIIYGVGFGAVTPNIPAGEIVTEQNQLTQTFEMEFGTAQAQVPYFGLAPNLVGVYQFNVVVPDVLDNDLVPLTFKLGGVAGSQTLFTAVHH